MKTLLATLTLGILVLFTTGCETTGGGGDRYEYPPSKLSAKKHVKSASLDGRFIILSDGSMWNIDWADAGKARRWGAGERVNVLATNGRSFPYALVKHSNGERVAARYGKKL